MTHSRLWSRGVHACCLVSLIVIGSCTTSAAPRKVAIADSHRGANVIVHMVNGAEHFGELLAVRDSSIILLTKNRIAIGSFADVRSVAIGDIGPTGIVNGRWSLETSLGKLAPASRFPFGIAASPMAVLLESTKQAAPADLRTLTP